MGETICHVAACAKTASICSICNFFKPHHPTGSMQGSGLRAAPLEMSSKTAVEQAAPSPNRRVPSPVSGLVTLAAAP
jgi:hypothetical protein